MPTALGSSPLTRGKPASRSTTLQRRGLIPAHAGKTSATHWRPLRSRAHPRSRGENTQPPGVLSSTRGSSPLTRGKRLQEQRRPNEGRLIPAHAGKTHHRRSIRKPRRAHPRSRGENIVALVQGLVGMGSSPLTRGKRLLRRGYRRDGRLIPAHAGKTTD